MKRIISLVLSLVITAGIFAANVTTSFHVTPGMSCQNCENKIKSNLRFEKGVKEIATSLKHQLVTITYDNEKTSPAKLIEAFKKIGYTATEARHGSEKKCHRTNGGKCCGKGDCAKTGNENHKK